MATRAPTKSGVNRARRRGVRDAEDHADQDEGDDDLRDEGRRGAPRPGHGRHVLHREMRHEGAERGRSDRDAREAAHHLRQHVEAGVRGRDLAEPPEGERRRRIEMGARALPPRRVDQGDGGQAHGEPHQDPPRERLGYRLHHRGARVTQERAEHARRDHEEAEPGRLHQVLGPVWAERLAQRYSPLCCRSLATRPVQPVW